ncbi:MAG: CAP domain-containing protein [Hyphomicrobiales bacterium]|nr:CAP domain-containing protein [Hyphomicrobiales bacterium]
MSGLRPLFMSPCPGAVRPTRRVVLLGGLAASLAACARSPLHVEEIDDVAYVPVDPQKALRLINAYRADNGVAPLALDGELTRLAREYAGHLADAGRMTHELEPYGGLEKRLRAGGYAYETAGENLGQGYRTIEQTIAGWKKSPPHDRGLKDADMTRMGIASVENPKKRGDVYWCLMFARPRRDPASLTPTPTPHRWGPEPTVRLWSLPISTPFGGR